MNAVQANRLRDRPDDFIALVSSASEHFGILEEFLEKDFWVTEALWAAIWSARACGAAVIFKGGTSLLKAFRLIERYSEDVDLVIEMPAHMGGSARHRVLRAVSGGVASHLGTTGVVLQSETGVKRNVAFKYRAHFATRIASEGVLLEMGIRGGRQPRSRSVFRSLIAEHAISIMDVAEDEFEELGPIEVNALCPERTLIEKLAHLHDVASRMTEPKGLAGLRRCGRHYYDVFRLLGDEETLGALREPGLVARLAADTSMLSRRFGFPCTDRPADGYAASPAFDPSHPSRAIVEDAYATASRLIWGEVPALEWCVERVHRHADLL